MIKTTPTIASTIALINEYAAAIADDTATDSSLDELQYDIDCILFPDDLDAEQLADAAFSPLAPTTFADHISSIDDIRAYATAAFNLRP